jgi:hypothetical protein
MDRITLYQINRKIKEAKVMTDKAMTETSYQGTTHHHHIPDVLRVPDENVLLLRARGTGVQKYTPPITADSKATPHAILLTRDQDEGDLVAIHFGGPTWEALDVAQLWETQPMRSIVRLRTRMGWTGC